MKAIEDIVNAHNIDEIGRQRFLAMAQKGIVIDAEFRKRLQADATYRDCLDAIVGHCARKP